MILSGIFLLAFFMLYLTQSTKSADWIYLYMRIERGQLSNQDIVNISRKQWNQNAYTDQAYRQAALQLNLSQNDRIYRFLITNGHKTTDFISRQKALKQIQHDNTRPQTDVYYLVNTVKPFFYFLNFRPEAI